jgi:hypothetical protein
VVLTYPVVEEQGVPSVVVASLYFLVLFLLALLIHFFHGLAQDPYDFNTRNSKQLSLYKMADHRSTSASFSVFV